MEQLKEIFTGVLKVWTNPLISPGILIVLSLLARLCYEQGRREGK